MLDFIQAAKNIGALDPSIVQAAIAIVGREGGLVDNKSDSGGITNYGVSLVHARAQGLAFDIDHNGVVNADDIRLVTPQIAELDFLEVFFVQPGLAKLPKCVQACAFDHAVNGGPDAAIRLVQATVNALIGNKSIARLTVDGALGPNTMREALQMADAVGDERMLNGYIDQREIAYHQIVAAHPQDSIFLKGWLNRADSFRPKITAKPVPSKPAIVVRPVVSQPTFQSDADNSSDDLNDTELARVRA